MIECKHPQGSPEWLLDRLGCVSASMASKIITSTGKPSTSAKAYRNQLLADWLAGEPVDAFEPTQAMQDGTDREEQARDLYQFVTDNEVTQTGFWFKDDRKIIGASPDGLVGDTGLVEIKNPKASTLVGYRIDGKLPSAYKQQVMFQMWVLNREWVDFFVAHPKIDHFLIRVNRDDKYIKTMEGLVEAFVDDMLEKRERLSQIKKVA